MPEDFSNDAISVEDLPDFSGQGEPVFEPPHTPEPRWSPISEVTPTTPEMQLKVNMALQNIDPRWNTRVPEPTIGGLIGQGLEWINRTFKAPEEPMPAPLTPIIVPPSVEKTPEEKLRERIYEVEHPVSTGLGKSAEKFMVSMAQPAGPISIAATPLAPEITLPMWAAMGTEGSLDALKRIREARQEGDRTKYYEAVGDLAVQSPMVAAPFVHAQAPELVQFPRSLRALGREPRVETPSNIVQPAVAPVVRAQAGEHPLLAAARIVEEAAANVTASGRVPAERVSDAINRVREALAQARAQAAATGQHPAAVTAETMAAGRAAPPSAADAAFAAAEAALNEAEAKVNRGRTPESTEPPTPINELGQVLIKAATAVRAYQSKYLQPQPQQQEVPSAVQERQAAEVLRDVQNKSVVSQPEVPSETGAGGVPPSIERPEETPKPAEVPLTPKDFEKIDAELSADIDRRGGIEKVSKSDAPEDVALMEHFQQNQSAWETAVSGEKAKFISELSDDAILQRAKDNLIRGTPREMQPEGDAVTREIEGRGLERRLKAMFEPGIYERLKVQTKPAEVPLTVQQAADAWRKAEKDWRRAMRQDPPEREAAEAAKIEAEGLFRDEAAKAGITQEQFDQLTAYARETETPRPEMAGKTEPILENEGFAFVNTAEGKSKYTPAIKTTTGEIIKGTSHEDAWANMEKQGAKPAVGGSRGYVTQSGEYVSLMDIAKRESKSPEMAGQKEAGAASDEVQIIPENPSTTTDAGTTAEPIPPKPTDPSIGEGPGAQTRGQGPYPAIQQLTDQLEATPRVGTRERLKIGERIADAWSRRGDAWTKAMGKMRNAGTTLKDFWEGVRKASDLDSRLGEYNYAIQYSSSASKRAGQAIMRQMRDPVDREAAAILIDSARIATKDPNRLAVNPDALATPAEVRQVIKDALDILPADTPKHVRLAMERALDPSLELRQFSEQLKQYYGLREQDAVGADLFKEGLEDYYTHVWKKESNMPDSLRGAIASGKVNTYFQFARERKIPSLIEGILEGKKPILDPAKVIPFYNFAMDRAIASRTLIKALSDIRASDSRPAVDVRGGAVIPDREATDSPVLVTPKAQAHEISDYMSINHPAMQGWKWVTNTPEGRNVMMRGDMVVHPEFHETLSRFMDRSRLTSSRLMAGALALGGTAKSLKLGLLPSTFHMVHVGTHAAFHWTNPFRWAPIDFEAPATRFAIEKGHLNLAPSPNELSLIEEGINSPLLKKIPLYGRFISAFSDFMFHQYIPRLKLNTFENAMARARSPLTATGRGLRAGRLTENDVASRIGDAANNAFGELNQMFLGKFGRDPKFQRMLRLVFLAPDFGEARLRFATKFFSRYGDEERLAIATMFGALYFGARVGNWLSHGNAESDDLRHAFEVKVTDSRGKRHWVGMRSVVGDLAHFAENPGQFAYVRLSPAYSRPVSDFLFGRDERTGAKLSYEKKFKRLAQAWEPIGLTGLSEPDRTLLESLGQSMGFANRRDMIVSDVAQKAHEWLDKQDRRPVSEVIPTEEPSYMKLRTALNIGKYKDAQKILNDLLRTRTRKQVEKAMSEYVDHPFTGSNDLEKSWIATLNKRDAQLYLQAIQEKQDTLVDFYRLIGGVYK